MWFIAYRHPLRPDEAGVKFVQDETASIAGIQQLAASGYVITSVAPTSKARMEAFLAGTLADPEQPLVG
jgi:hypothetical protein